MTGEINPTEEGVRSCLPSITRTAFDLNKSLDVKNIHRPHLRLTLYVIHQAKTHKGERAQTESTEFDN